MRKRENWILAGIIWLCGIVIHNFILSNKLSYGDDVYSHFHVGGTWGSGRWFLGILDVVTEKIGFRHFSMPTWNGGLLLLFLALSALLLIDIFEIQKLWHKVLLGVALESFPVIASLMAYMFTAAYYGFALFLAVAAVWLTVKKHNGWIPGALLVCLSMGIYQSDVTVTSSLLLVLLIQNREGEEGLRRLTRAITYAGELAIGFVAYWICSKIALAVTDTPYNSYQGIDGLQTIGGLSLLRGMEDAYRSFLVIAISDVGGLSNNRFAKLCYALLILLGIVASMICIIRERKVSGKLLTAFFAILLPLSIGAMFATSQGGTTVHTLMLWSYFILTIYAFVVFAERDEDSKFIHYLEYASVAVLTLLTINNIRVDNVAYLKAEHLQEVGTAYALRLEEAILSTDGYEQGMPVYLYGDEISDASLAYLHEYDEITLLGYGMNEGEFIQYFVNAPYMQIHTGFYCTMIYECPETVSQQELDDMATYPDEGGIKIINGTLVVKRGE